MKFKFYILFFTCLILASCASNKYADVTKVNPDNQITGKGIGKSIPAETATKAEPEIKEVAAAPEALVAKEESVAISEIPVVENVNVVPLNKTADFSSLKDEKAISSTDIVKIAPQVFSLNTIGAVKEYKQRKGVMGFVKSLLKPQADVLLLILAFLIPPLAVGLAVGITGQFWLNLLLTLLFFIPGVIHAIIVVVNNT